MNIIPRSAQILLTLFRHFNETVRYICQPMPNKAFSPENFRRLSVAELTDLVPKIIAFLVAETDEKAGHIQSSATVAELTLALHYVFNTPHDILIWDVGHQAYVHKIITDRAARFFTNRKKGGISGFTNRTESTFDPFGAGHSSTSISAIGGFAQAAKLQGINRAHIAVIGDGALNGGMAYEALNHLGASGLDILLVLNDNESSIDASVGALHEFQSYAAFFDSLGWGYSGPIDGHNLPKLVDHLTQEKQNTGTRVLHVKTTKVESSRFKVQGSRLELNEKSFADVFADTLSELAAENERIIAITPAMLSGSSLVRFQSAFPARTFDVGIAEQHAVTFAAGLAASGMRPLVHLYSTFAQRAYDQIIHDVALQNLPVVFAIDRAGLVGEDGATHHGAFDLSFLNPIPNLQILAPMSGAELGEMLNYAFAQNGPVVIRFPRGSAAIETSKNTPMLSGSFRVLSLGTNVCVVSLGAIGVAVKNALAELDQLNIGHIDLRFLKPWQDYALKSALASYSQVVTVEEGSLRGGLRDSMASWLKVHLPHIELHGLGLPDRFIAHATPNELATDNGLSSAEIALFLQRIFAVE